MSRRFRRRPPLWFWLTIIIAAAIVGRWWFSTRQDSRQLAAGEHVVTDVVDGRTLQVKPGIAVRLLGVKIIDDLAARHYLAENVVGQTIRIQLDRRRRAADGSQFAYVYLGRTFVNAELIRHGYAEYEAYPGDSASHAKMLRDAK